MIAKRSFKLLFPSALCGALFFAGCETNTPVSEGERTLATSAATTVYRSYGAVKGTSSVLTAKQIPNDPPASALPPKIDLSWSVPPVISQDPIGGCVAFSTGYYARTMAERIEYGSLYDVKLAANQFSPSWIYNQLKPSADCSRGFSIAQALDLLKNGGDDVMAYFPFNGTCAEMPDAASRYRAKNAAIKDWGYINPTTDAGIIKMKETIKSYKPVIIGVRTWSNFDTWTTAKEVWDTFEGNANENYHAMAVVAYDDYKQAFKVVNSWSTGWGNNGYAWIAYKMFKDPRLEAEAYFFNRRPKPVDHVIKRWNKTTTPNKWEPSTTGGAVDIAVTPAGIPWVINKSREIWFKKGPLLADVFEKTPGILASDIAAGPDGSVWITGGDLLPSYDYPIYKWNATTKVWQKTSNGGAVKIAVAPGGIPWVVNSAGDIWKKSDSSLTSSFSQVLGIKASDIGIGKDGSVWVVGTNNMSQTLDHAVFKYVNGKWEISLGLIGVAVAVEPGGVPWVVKADGKILKENDNSPFTVGVSQITGVATDIAISANNVVWATGVGQN